MKHIFPFAMVLVCFTTCRSPQTDTGQTADLATYVNPFIGTDAHGHTFPGATLPFGMVQLSPDTRLEGWDGCSGYHYSDNVVFGFSHTHLSGTGVADYADILFMPTTGPAKLNNGASNPDEGYASRFSHARETASPGYYSVFLNDYQVSVELTATRRAGFHQYTFPAGEQSNIIIDLEHRDKVLESGITFVSSSQVEGFRRSSSWAKDQIVFFVAQFSRPADEYGIASDDLLTGKTSEQGSKLKALLRYSTSDKEVIKVKVGISAVSVEGARKNLEAEIPEWDFDGVKAQAREAWNRELGRITVKGGTEAQKTTFYTALYHAFIAPNLFMDVDGRYRGRDFQIHTAGGYEYHTVFSLWDTFRGLHPLFTLLQEKKTVDLIQTMITQYEQGGRLPVWELAANETECMIGYHSVPVIVDAYMKGIRAFDAEKALEAMKHSAEADHFGLKQYRAHGFIPAEEEGESVSKTLEYAYDDWCIALMAKELGKTDDYGAYMKRAQSWKNLFDPSTGFMRARMNGRWFEPFDPREVNFNYTEANAWQYSFFVPQDIGGMISFMGGNEPFTARLDQLFEESPETTGRKQSDITGLIGQYAHGNEPSHHMAYLYNYARQPWKTQQRVRQIMDELYSEKPDGLCGNEDCGQMSAWYILSALGFYSVTPGDTYYAIGSPLFEEATLHLENGNTFTISARGNSPDAVYIKSATLNGTDWDASFIRHEDIMKGGELVLEMRTKPNKAWATHDKAIPIPHITEHLIMPVPYIGSGSRTFVDSTVVALGSITEGAVLYFTLDGTMPSESAQKYNSPLVLHQTTTLNAIAVAEGLPSSRVLTAQFFRIPAGRKITLNTRYEGQYSAGGDLALIDFIRGPLNFRTGSWQGYQGVDIDAVVDLGSIQLITSLETGFLQDIKSWIFMPESISYYSSIDGESFQHLATLKNDVPEQSEEPQIKNFALNMAIKARYIKVMAKNRGICPPWHPGDGNPSWIFADEIVIE